MKQFLLLLSFLALCFSLQAQYFYLDGDFDQALDAGWTSEGESAADQWVVKDGSAVFSGERIGAKASLTTPVLNLTTSALPIVRLVYIADQYGGVVDRLGVYVRKSVDADWVLIAEFSSRRKEMCTADARIPDTLISTTAQIRIEAEYNGGRGISLDRLTVVAEDVCVNAPTNFVLNKVSQSSATFLWTTAPEAKNTRIIISRDSIKDFSDIDETTLVADNTMPAKGNANMYIADDLAGGTKYVAYVQADCQYGDISQWTSLAFATPCTAVETPYNDDFERYESSDDLGCWQYRTTGGDEFLPKLDTLADAENQNNKAIRLTTGKDIYTYLYTPEFNVEDITTMALAFSVYSDQVESATGSADIEVGVMTNPANPQTFAAVHSVSPTQNKTWQSMMLSFADYEGDYLGNYGKYIAFKVGNLDKSTMVAIDNISLTASDCFAPQMVKADSIRAHAARISWTEMGKSVSWKVRIVTEQLTDEQLAVPQPTDSTSGSKSVNVYGLQPATTYYVYVQSDCGTWSKRMQFKTEPVLPIGYDDEFDKYASTMPHSWIFGETDPKTGTIKTSTRYASITAEESENHTGSAAGALKFEAKAYFNPFVIMPEVDVSDIKDAQIRFYARTGHARLGFVVGVCSDIDFATFQPVDTIYPTELNTYKEYIFTFENLSGKGKCIALSSTMTQTTMDSYACIFDDLKIEAFKECNKPQSLEARDITEKGALVSWRPMGSKTNSWQVQFKRSASKDWLQTTVESPRLLLDTFTYNTAYDIRVRSACGNGQFSDWTDVLQFRTLAYIDIPYTNNFTSEETGVGKTPGGWVCFNDRKEVSYGESNIEKYTPYVDAAVWTVGAGQTLPEGVETNSLRFQSSRLYLKSWAVMPILKTGFNINELSLEFVAYSNARNLWLTKYNYDLEVGIMSNPDDISTFELLETIHINSINTPQRVYMTLAGYKGKGRFIAFRTGVPDYNVDLMIDNVKVDNLPECAELTELAVTGVTSTTATIEWVKGNKETEWDVKLFGRAITADEVETATGNIETATPTQSNPFTITGLSANTEYWVALRAKTANCAGPWSVIDFVTDCPSTFHAPFNDSFDNYKTNDIPKCWIAKAGSKYGKIMLSEASGDTPDFIGGTESGKVLVLNGADDKYSYLIFPEFNLDITDTQLSFMARSGRSLNFPAIIEVGVMESVDETFTDPTTFGGTSDDLFTLVRTIRLNSYHEWFERRVLFDEYEGDGKHIAIRLGGYGYSVMLIDQLSVRKIPECQDVEEVIVTELGVSSVTLSWDAAQEKHWNVKVAKQPIDPNQTDAKTVFSKEVESNEYQVTDLEPNTRYYAYVQRVDKTIDCVGEWSDAVSFNTDCSPIDLNFTDDFESNGEFYGNEYTPRCWAQSGTDPKHAYPAWVSSKQKADNDSMMMVIQNNSFYDNTIHRDVVYTSYVALPSLNVDSIEEAQISFSAYQPYDENYDAGAFEIGVMTDPTDPSTYVPVYSAKLVPDKEGSGIWTKYTVNFLNYIADEYGEKGLHIAFNVLPSRVMKHNQAGRNIIYIDDVAVEAYQSCATPSALKIDTLYGNTAVLSWTSSPVDSFRVVMSASDNVDPAFAIVDTVVKTNPVVVSNLPGNTCIYARVAAICPGGETQSPLSEHISFRTKGCNLDMPYTEGFELVDEYKTDYNQDAIVPVCYTSYQPVLGFGFGGEIAQDGDAHNLLAYVARKKEWNISGRNTMGLGCHTYAILPDFNIDDVRKLAIRFNYRTNEKTDIEVGVLEDVGNPESYRTLRTFAKTPEGFVGCAEVNLAEFEDVKPSSRLVIKSNGDMNGWDYYETEAYVDNILVDYNSKVWAPGKITVDKATDIQLHFSWIQIGEPDNWHVSVLPVGEVPNEENLVSVTEPRYVCDNLSANTPYNIYVRAEKGGVYTEWTTLASHTLGKAITPPYSTSFENPADNANWVYAYGTTGNADAVNRWIIGSAVSSSPDNALYISNNGIDYAYSATTSSVNAAYAFRSISIEHAGVYNVSLKVRGNATSYDVTEYLSVALMPSEYIPDGSAECRNIYTGERMSFDRNENANVVVSKDFSSKEWTDVSVSVRIDKPGTYNLLCFWHNQDGNQCADCKPAAIDDLSITENLCPDVYDLRVKTLADTVVGLEWGGSVAAAWNVTVATEKVSDMAELDESDILTVEKTETPEFKYITKPSTELYFYVVPVCAVDNSGFKCITAATLCNAEPIPYVEPFNEGYDNYGAGKECWLTPDGANPPVYRNLYVTYEDWVILPLLDADLKDLQMTFEMSVNRQYGTENIVEIGLLSSPSDLSSYTGYETHEFTSELFTMTRKYVNFADYEGSSRFIAIRPTTNTEYYLSNLVIDSISECSAPWDVVVTDIAAEEASVGWKYMSEQTEWRVVVSAEGNLTPANLDTIRHTAFVDTVNTCPAKVGGLTHSTRYYVYVGAVCEDGGEWSLPVEFTSGLKPLDLPYSENFDAVPEAKLPVGWLRSNTSLTAIEEGGVQMNFFEADNRFAVFPTDGKTNALHTLVNSGSSETDYWAVSPQIVLDGGALMSFDLDVDYATESGSNVTSDRKSAFRLLVTTDDGKSWNTADGLLISDGYGADMNFDEVIDTCLRLHLDLSDYSGDTIRFGFYSESREAANLSVNIDSINIRCAQTYKYTDKGYESYDYSGYGFDIEYDQVIPNMKSVTRYVEMDSDEVCDSIVTLTIDVQQTKRTELDSVICEGDVYTLHNFNAMHNGQYIQRLNAASGADSVVILDLSVRGLSMPTAVEHTVCAGERYEFGGRLLEVAGIYYDTVPDRFICDSVTVLTLTVNSGDTSYVEETITADQLPYMYDGRKIVPVGSAPGLYQDTVSVEQTDGSCPETVIFAIHVNGPTAIDNVKYETLTITPNPVEYGDVTTIGIDASVESGVLEIIDLNGMRVTTLDFEGRKVLVECRFPSGVYVVRIVAPDIVTECGKLIVR